MSNKTLLARILFGTWWVFITIVTAFYTAQLTVVLASSSRLLPVNNLEDLHLDPAASWLATGGGALQTILSTWPDFADQQADLRAGKGGFVPSESDALAALETAGDNKYFLTDSGSAKRLVFTDYQGKGSVLFRLNYFSTGFNPETILYITAVNKRP